MPAQNGLIGDSFGTDIPQTNVPEDDLQEERRRAKFAKTPEFEKLKQHMEERTKFYESHLPNGRNILELDNPSQAGQMWIVANAVIGELQLLISTYEGALAIIEEKDNAKR